MATVDIQSPDTQASSYRSMQAPQAPAVSKGKKEKKEKKSKTKKGSKLSKTMIGAPSGFTWVRGERCVCWTGNTYFKHIKGAGTFKVKKH